MFAVICSSREQREPVSVREGKRGTTAVVTVHTTALVLVLVLVALQLGH